MNLSSKNSKNTHKKIRGSIATYKDSNNFVICDLDQLAHSFAVNWGNVPKSINDIKAQELHLLAKAYLSLKQNK